MTRNRAAGKPDSVLVTRVRAGRARRILPIVLAVAIWAAAPPLHADGGVVVNANVDAKEIPVGETLSFTIEVQGAGMSGVAPSTPAGLTNLQVVGGPRTSTSFSFVNGAVSSSKSFTWFLAPQAQGKARIPPLDVKVGDKIYRTEPIDISVTPAGTGSRTPAQPSTRLPGAPSRSEPGLNELRLETEVSAERVYVGQPVILTTRLLTRVQVVDVSAGPDPTLPGFLLEEADTNVAPERVFREGREYQSFVLMKRILTPTTPGKTVVPPETRTIRIRSSSRDVFESFFSPRVLEVIRTTSPTTLEALATPAAGRPADFSGAVGSFKMQVVADRRDAAVGDAVGVKVTLNGSGNLKTVDHPVLGPSADFRVFDPRVEEKSSGTKPRTYTKTWSYVMTPLSPGDLALPSLSFSYFDPDAKAYRRLSSSLDRLAVKRAEPGSSAGAVASMTARREVQSLQRDIRFLKSLDSPLRRKPAPPHSHVWVWALLSLAALAQPAAWYIRRSGGAVALLPGGRHGGARRRALADIARARSASGDRLRAYSVAAEALLRFVTARCGIPAHGLTYEEIGAELARRGVRPELREELQQLLELCDLGRFAPEGTRQEASAELLARTRALVEQLDRQIGRAA